MRMEYIFLKHLLYQNVISEPFESPNFIKVPTLYIFTSSSAAGK